MADRRDKLNKTLIMIGIVSAVVVIIIAKIFQMKPQSLKAFVIYTVDIVIAHFDISFGIVLFAEYSVKMLKHF